MLMAHTATQMIEITFESLNFDACVRELLLGNTDCGTHCSPNSSSFCCRGVFSVSVSAISVRILPISVLSPVPNTTPRAFPEATFVPEKRQFFLS